MVEKCNLPLDKCENAVLKRVFISLKFVGRKTGATTCGAAIDGCDYAGMETKYTIRGPPHRNPQIEKPEAFSCSPAPLCGRGGIGRRTSFGSWPWTELRVQIPSPALQLQDTAATPMQQLQNEL
jgi:hypothetical protein